MKKIYDSGMMDGILSRADIPDGLYVNVNYPISGTSMSKREGLDRTLEILDTGLEQPLILYSLESPFSLFEDKRFMRIMANEGVHFLRCPFSLEGILGVIKLPTFDNPALRAAADYEGQVDLLKVLAHNYHSRPNESIQRARTELNLTGTDAEIADALSSGASLETSYEGRLPGVFCDIDGTLYKDGEINDSVVKMLVDYARSSPVNLWTGGDVKALSRKVGPMFEKSVPAIIGKSGRQTNLHLRTPMLSKHIFNGARAKIVIDNLAQEDFVRAYNIKPEKYIGI